MINSTQCVRFIGGLKKYVIVHVVLRYVLFALFSPFNDFLIGLFKSNCKHVNQVKKEEEKRRENGQLLRFQENLLVEPEVLVYLRDVRAFINSASTALNCAKSSHQLADRSNVFNQFKVSGKLPHSSSSLRSFKRSVLNEYSFVSRGDFLTRFSSDFFLQVAIVITDGKQTTDRGSYTELSVASRGLKNKGAMVFSLGIGRNVDLTQLNDIASSNDNVFTAASFAELAPVAENIVQNSCPGKFSLRMTHQEVQITTKEIVVKTMVF